MKRSFRNFATLIFVVALSACGSGNSGLFRSGPERAAQQSVEQRDSIDRLVPEDASIPRSRLAAIIDAIRTVRKDIPKEDLPLDGNAVRKVLRGFTQAEISRVESLVPAMEKRRKAEGLD
jgi:hypothetical protein